ncbi:hypothetical protein JG687_00007105 [Phytophthora cactorum]|uniref:Uncharacterized protein n=1 Tax=Phytophthora cactorum TaxID=29920 RepID=A0A8T1UG40_9STRA|nr:hypothetical protein JG687_00007105 [Phytophthora cactorum]
MKPQVAHIIANLPTTKSIMAPAHISRIMSKALLQRANKKVMTLQKKNRALAERDVGVEFPGLVVIGGQSLMSMRRWHQAIDAFNRLDRTKKWIAELGFTTCLSAVCLKQIVSKGTKLITSWEAFKQSLKEWTCVSRRHNVCCTTHLRMLRYACKC